MHAHACIAIWFVGRDVGFYSASRPLSKGARRENQINCPPVRVAALIKARKPGFTETAPASGCGLVTMGSSSWVLRYMMQGKAHEMGLGPTHSFSLAEARERARRFRQGRDELFRSRGHPPCDLGPETLFVAYLRAPSLDAS